MSGIVPMLRLGVFGASLLFSLIVLGIDGDAISKFPSSAPASNSLGLADAVLTLVSLGPLLAIGLIRQGAMVSMVLVDLIVVFILWVLWLTAAAYTASQWSGSCSVVFYNGFLDYGSGTNTVCTESKAAAAFAFLTFFALLGYWVTLLVYSIIAMSNGNGNIWTTPVTEADFSEKAARNINAPPGTGYPQPQHHAMQQQSPNQYQGTPQYQGAPPV